MRWCRAMGLVFASAAALGGLTAGCSGSSDGAIEVTMLDNRYQPESIEVVVGETVDFINEGRVDHNVIDADGRFDSRDGDGDHLPGQTWSHTFTEAGVYHIYCSLHATQDGDGAWQGMVGTVTVVAG